MDLRDVLKKTSSIAHTYLDEGLDLGALCYLLLAHLSGHLPGVTVDTGDQRVSIGLV